MTSTSILTALAVSLLVGSHEPARGAEKRAESDCPSCWRVLGPGGGGAQFNATISPHNPDVMLLNCDMSGIYISKDGGDNWRMFHLRAEVRQFVFHPTDEKVIFAAGTGLWRSDDEGATWSMVFPDADQVTGIEHVEDEAEMRILAGDLPRGRVQGLAVDPGSPDMVYLGAGDGLFVSTDRGGTWKLAAKMPAEMKRALVLRGDAPSRSVVWITGAAWSGIWNGEALVRQPLPAGSLTVTDARAARSPEGDPVIYLIGTKTLPGGGEEGVLYRSTSHGKDWEDRTDAFRSLNKNSGIAPKFRALAASQSSEDMLLVSFFDLGLEEAPALPSMGIAKSIDGGGTWQILLRFSDTPPGNVGDDWIVDGYGADWPGESLSLAMAPTNENLILATDYARTLRSRNGGKNWEQIDSRRLADGSVTSRGIDVTTCYGIHFDPFEPGHALLTCTDIGMLRTENGTRGWVPARAGMPRTWRNTAYWAVFDPEVKGRVWAATSGAHDLPRFKMWRRRSPDTYRGGVVASSDGGRTWAESGTGLPESAITFLVLDPRSPVEARVLFAAAFGRGVYKSVDGGQHWERRNNGLFEADPFALRLAMDSEGALYLVTTRRHEKGVSAPGDGRIYISRDGAESWTALTLPDGVNGPTGLVVDPDDPKRILVSAWSNYVGGSDLPGHSGGIYLSEDAGATWKQVQPQDQYIYDVSSGGAGTGVFYATGFKNSVYRSEDRGATWRRIPGINFKAPHRVIPDPADPGKIYVATYGSSTWHGPAQGDPEAQEEIAGPPPLRYTPNAGDASAPAARGGSRTAKRR